MPKGNRRSKVKNPASGRLVKDNLNIHEIQPLTTTQEDAFEAFEEGYNLLFHGKPGTGKTFLAMYLGLKAIQEGEFRRMVIVRSAVQGRDIGATPGTVDEKAAVYEGPYVGICTELFGRADAYGILKKKDIIRFLLTSFNRGITLDDTIIVVDECQNMNYNELDTIIGRVGKNSRIIYAGDVCQDDLTSKRKKEESGLGKFIEVLSEMEEFDFLEFGVDDIVRSGLVKSYIMAKIKHGLA